MLGAISDANMKDVFNPIARHEHHRFSSTMPPITLKNRSSLHGGMSMKNIGGDHRLRTRVNTMGLHRRASPRQRKLAEMTLCKMQVDDWMGAHHLTRKIEVPPAQRQSLREVFDMIDADHGGTIDLEEMSVIMSAQGFKPNEIKEAMRIGDSNGDGELDFEEFVSLVGTIGSGRNTADTTAHVAGPAGNTFPFALVANGYRIKQLIDAFDPVVRENALKLKLASSSTKLPPIAGAESKR